VRALRFHHQIGPIGGHEVGARLAPGLVYLQNLSGAGRVPPRESKYSGRVKHGIGRVWLAIHGA